MQHAQILSILYDMALVIGSEDRLKPLLINTLHRFIYHTSFPCGLLALREPEEGPTGRLYLRAALGDHLLASHIGERLTLPAGLSEGKAALLEAPELIDALPLHRGKYRYVLRLPIPGQGILLLFSERTSAGQMPFAEMFRPVLANFARAIELCRRNEAYAREIIADRDQAKADLLRFRSALDTSTDYVFLIDPERMQLIDFNRRVEHEWGFSREDLLRLDFPQIVSGFTEAQWRDRFCALLQGDEEAAQFDTVQRGRDGSEFPAEFRLSVLHREDSVPVIIALARDITERKLAEEALFQEKEKALVTLHSIGDAVITTDCRGRVEYLNPIAERLTGWCLEEAIGLEVGKVFRIINERTRQRVENPVQLVLSHGNILGLANHTILISRSGSEIPIEDSAAPIRDRDGAIIGVVMVFHDVTKTRELARQLSWQATHDALTGLFNRHEFEYRLRVALQNAAERDQHHVMLYLDLDQFKLVNDTSGHAAGDELLKHLSQRFSEYVRDSDALARLGGDEFGVLLENCPLPQAKRIAEKLRQVVSEFRFVWKDKTFDIGVSIGVAPIDSSSESVAAVMTAADLACYAAKERGRNYIQVYRIDDVELARRRGEMHLVSSISEALEENRFQLYSQSFMALSDGRMESHCEVLLRMLTREGELLQPSAFIPAAERFSLMPLLDRWVIEQVFSLLGRQRAMQGVFAINLSGTSLGDDELLDFILAAFERYGVAPQQICFEITETAAIANLSRASRLMRELNLLGCRFALDDFGSGLSSFGYLKALPVDYLKIDGSFIRELLENPLDLAVVESINNIGHVLGKLTIAEFVEDDVTLERLRSLGVDYVQGYAVERPRPLEEQLRKELGTAVSTL